MVFIRLLCYKKSIYVIVSRKSFIGQILYLKNPKDRLFAYLSDTSLAVYYGAHIIRTRDVLSTLQTVKLDGFIKKFIRYLVKLKI